MNTTTQYTAKVSKGFYGTTVETVLKGIEGFDWQITTMKRSNGTIWCSAQGGHFKTGEGFDSFSFIMFQDPRHSLAERKARATEKVLSEVHAEGMNKFFELQAQGCLTSSK